MVLLECVVYSNQFVLLLCVNNGLVAEMDEAWKTVSVHVVASLFRLVSFYRQTSLFSVLVPQVSPRP